MGTVYASLGYANSADMLFVDLIFLRNFIRGDTRRRFVLACTNGLLRVFGMFMVDSLLLIYVVLDAIFHLYATAALTFPFSG